MGWAWGNVGWAWGKVCWAPYDTGLLRLTIRHAVEPFLKKADGFSAGQAIPPHFVEPKCSLQFSQEPFHLSLS